VEVKEYQSAAGKIPLTEWLDALRDPVTRARIVARLDRLEEGDARAVPIALRTVAEAVGGMAVLASKTRLSRETLYRTLSARAHLAHATTILTGDSSYTTLTVHQYSYEAIGNSAC
jgi:DNA-binding phage protein